MACASSETQGQIVEARESLNRGENMAQKKSKERPEEPLGTMPYQTSSKRSPSFWLMIGARKTQVFLGGYQGVLWECECSESAPRSGDSVRAF